MACGEPCPAPLLWVPIPAAGAELALSWALQTRPQWALLASLLRGLMPSRCGGRRRGKSNRLGCSWQGWLCGTLPGAVLRIPGIPAESGCPPPGLADALEAPVPNNSYSLWNAPLMVFQAHCGWQNSARVIPPCGEPGSKGQVEQTRIGPGETCFAVGQKIHD